MSTKKNIPLKQRIIYGLISGLIFASIKAILDRDFSPIEFTLGVIIFGFIMALIMQFKEKNN